MNKQLQNVQTINALVSKNKLISIVLLLVVLLFTSAYVANAKSNQNDKQGLEIVLVNKSLSVSKQQQLLQIVKPINTASFIMADINIINSKIAELDWVKSVQTSRIWPNNLAIDVTERVAIARFGTTGLLSADGTIFTGDEQDLYGAKNLPLLYSSDKLRSKQLIKTYFVAKQWFERSNIKLQEMSVNDKLTWILSFNTGMRVIVDRENSQIKLFRLSTLLGGKLKRLHKNIKAIDLRYRNGFSITWKKNKPQRLQNLLK